MINSDNSYTDSSRVLWEALEQRVMTSVIKTLIQYVLTEPLILCVTDLFFAHSLHEEPIMTCF